MKLNFARVLEGCISNLAALMTAASRREASAMSTQSRPSAHMNSIGWRVVMIIVMALSAITLELGVTLPVQANGNYGPDTCLQGWVWREAVPGDHVCVTGATRSQAAYDNSQATTRRSSLLLWHTTYTIPPVCNGDTCSTTSTDDIPRYRLHGNHINVGPVTVQLRRSSDNTLLRVWTINATSTSSASGGQFHLDTGVFVCNGSFDSYFRVFDPTSTRWSDPYYVKTICNVL